MRDGMRAQAESSFFGDTVSSVRSWLTTIANEDGLANSRTGLVSTELPAFEFALAAYVKNHDADLLELTCAAAVRLNASAKLDELANETLAEWIALNLHLFQVSRDARFEEEARRGIETANSRWDETLKFFKVSVRNTANVFWTLSNARLGEAFYVAWRVLNDPSVRDKAGEVLGRVSEGFEPGEGLYQRVELPGGVKSEAKQLGAYAAAMQMFLTASETTGRRTYMARAWMVADCALDTLDLQSASSNECAAFADALVRLEQFSGESRFGERARNMLENAVSQARPDASNVSLTLAFEHAEHFPLHVVIIGDVDSDENARGLWLAALNEFASTRAIEVLHPAQHEARIRQLGYAASDKSALAYICSGTLCLPPVASVEAMSKAMEHIRVPPPENA